MGYNFLLWVNGVFNAVRRRLGFGYWSLSAYIKHKVKQATSAIARFEDAVVRHARGLQCDGVVCGHIHEAWGQTSKVGGTEIINLGPSGRLIEV